jgi:Protein of unknown function (DUF2845)
MRSWLLLAALACLPGLASAQSFRCSDRIISTGATRAEVAGLCGDPAQVEHKTIYNNVSASEGRRSSLVAGTAVEIQLEFWIYNFGPNKLMQRVHFEDGIVTRIESLGYGF